MAIAVWDYDYDFGALAPFEFEESVIEMGAGAVKTVSHEVAESGPDGFGLVTSNVGSRPWNIVVTDLTYDEAKDRVLFLRARKNGAGDDRKIYFYNRYENDDQTTWTGDTPSSGTNSHGQAVTEGSGRYEMVVVGPINWTWTGPMFTSEISFELRKAA